MSSNPGTALLILIVQRFSKTEQIFTLLINFIYFIRTIERFIHLFNDKLMGFFKRLLKQLVEASYGHNILI